MPPARSLNQRAVVCLHASAAPAGAQLQGQLLVNKCTRKQLKHTLKQHRKNLCAALQLEQRPEAALTGLLNDLRCVPSALSTAPHAASLGRMHLYWQAVCPSSTTVVEYQD